MTNTAQPNPGSQEAIDKGCTCPVMDNHYGKGFQYGNAQCFYHNELCPLQGYDAADYTPQPDLGPRWGKKS